MKLYSKYISTNKIILVWIILLLSFPLFGHFIKAYNTTNIYNLGKDSIRFINLAESILSGGAFQGKEIFYLGYSLILSFFFKFKLSFNFVVLFQCLMSLISAIYLKKISKKLGLKNPEIVMILFLFCIPIQMRNFFILSDSIFISFSIITFYYFIKKKNIKNILIFICLSLFTFTIRPHGILILLLIIIYFFEIVPKSHKNIYRFVYIFVLGIPFIYLLDFYLDKTTKNYFYISGEVIFGYKEIIVEYKNLPKNLIEKSVIYQNIYLLLNFPLESIKLYLYKIFFFVSGLRPYYSLSHNILEFFTTFVFFIIGIVSLCTGFNNKIKNYIMLIIFFYILGALVTGPDWSGRYRMYLMPFIYILSAEIIERFFYKFKINRRNN